jgi:hypothetical protein
MSMHGLYTQRAKFEDFKLELWNAHNKVQEMQWKANVARKEPDMSSMTAAELNAAINAHAGGVLNADRGAQEASEKHAGVCRKFRTWCAQQRESIPRDLDDPARVFENPDERAGWQELHGAIVEYLPSLEAECPTGDDPQPPPPIGTAQRWTR